MIHYHGTPITPREQLLRMGGRHFCVSFAAPQDLKTCLHIGQSLMLDNGAFSVYTRGAKFDERGFYNWIEPVLAPPHWAVIPDAIGGSLEDQHAMLSRFPRETFGYANVAAVFHLHLPLEHLHFLVSAYQRVCLGSSGEFWDVGSAKWEHRMDEIFNYLAKKNRVMPYIHGMRMLGQCGGRWPMASADSTNIAQNHSKRGCAECMAERIDVIQPQPRWKARQTQMDIFA